jgi:hypothetical protein
MNSKRFAPCALTLLLLLGAGGQVLASGAEAKVKFLVAAIYIVVGVLLVVLRERIAALWSSSILLPIGCAAMLVLAGLSAIARGEVTRTTPTVTKSADAISPKHTHASSL